MRPRSIGSSMALAAGSVAVVHLAPAVTALGPVRRRGWPGLSGVGADHHVALTFDDGPDPASTPAFLRALAELEVSATFFLLGRMLARAPSLGRELVDSGHEVAVHGWDHRLLVTRRRRATVEDLARAVDEVHRTCGVTPRFYRPPYGVLTWAAHRAALDLGMTPVLWTAWGRDWRSAATAGSVARDVARGLGPGGTVLLHDCDSTSAPGSWRATLAALPSIVDQIRRAGLAPGPLRDHGLAARSAPLAVGRSR
jgi:peptidoglycan/xylan/chitin deacetylase (PgdA/CDA1 family)